MKSTGRKIGAVVGNVLVFVLLFLAVAASFSIVWVKNHFGNITIEEIFYTIRMPLKGTGGDLVSSYIGQAATPTIITIVLLLTVTLTTMKKGHLRPRIIGLLILGLALIWWSSVIFYTNRQYSLFSYLKSCYQTSGLIKREYRDPNKTAVSFPDKKRNIIWLYIESAETTLQDTANGGIFDKNYIPELTRLAIENTSFSQSDKLQGAAVSPGASWTMGGLVAQSCGLPLKLHEGDTENKMGKYRYFLPGVTSFGEILQKNGYHNYFLAGSDFVFGARDQYYSQHGDYDITDYKTAIKEKWIPSDYKVWWGFEDEKLYEFAKKEITRIAAQGEPFNYNILTVDTHQVDGYKCRLCQKQYDEQYANVWACASRQAASFLEWCSRQAWFDNTTIIVTGDHCSMEPEEFFLNNATDKEGGT